MTTPKTTWRGPAPLDTVAKPPARRGRPPKAPKLDPVEQADQHQLDAVAGLQITNDPVPKRRTLSGSKYDSVFANLQPGWCIMCPPGLAEVGRIANALRKWHQVRGYKAVIRSCAKYHTDGRGRVWLVSLEKGASK